MGRVAHALVNRLKMEIKMNEIHTSQPLSTGIAAARLPQLNQLLGLEGRRTIVSGGASGIGYAVSRLLSQVGMNVEILDRNVPPAIDDAALPPE